MTIATDLPLNSVVQLNNLIIELGFLVKLSVGGIEGSKT